jgi:hypothetical protein
MILELLPLRGFFAHFDLAGLNQRSLASNSQCNNHSWGGFLVHELVIPNVITIPGVDSSFMSL